MNHGAAARETFHFVTGQEDMPNGQFWTSHLGTEEIQGRRLEGRRRFILSQSRFKIFIQCHSKMQQASFTSIHATWKGTRPQTLAWRDYFVTLLP